MKTKDLRVLNPMVSKDLSALSNKELMAYAVKAQELLEEVRNYELAKRVAYDNLKDATKIVRTTVKKEISKVVEKSNTLEFKSEEECLDNYYLELNNTGGVVVPKHVKIQKAVKEIVKKNKETVAIPSLQDELKTYKEDLENKVVVPEVVAALVDADLICEIMCNYYGACINNNQQTEVRTIELAEKYISSIEEGRKNITFYNKAVEELNNCTNKDFIDEMKKALGLVTAKADKKQESKKEVTNKQDNTVIEGVNIFTRPINNIDTVNLYDGYHNEYKYGNVTIGSKQYVVEVMPNKNLPTVFGCINMDTILAVKSEIEKAYGKDFFSTEETLFKVFRGKIENYKGVKLNVQCSKLNSYEEKYYEGFVEGFYFVWQKDTYKKPIVLTAKEYADNRGTHIKANKITVTDTMLQLISKAIEEVEKLNTNLQDTSKETTEVVFIEF